MVGVLLGLMVISIMPFNAFHKHTSDLHTDALLDHDFTHHCELDEAICGPETLHPCTHTAHIGTPLPDCFSCTFSFIKHYTPGESVTQNPISVYCTLSTRIWFSIPSTPAPVCMNKGPPDLIS